MLPTSYTVGELAKDLASINSRDAPDYCLETDQLICMFTAQPSNSKRTFNKVVTNNSNTTFKPVFFSVQLSFLTSFANSKYLNDKMFKFIIINLRRGFICISLMNI